MKCHAIPIVLPGLRLRIVPGVLGHYVPALQYVFSVTGIRTENATRDVRPARNIRQRAVHDTAAAKRHKTLDAIAVPFFVRRALTRLDGKDPAKTYPVA